MKLRTLLIISLFFLILSPLIVHAQNPESYLSIISESFYYLRGETGTLIIRSESSVSVTLEIIDPEGLSIFEGVRNTNSSGVNVFSFPVSQSSIYGDYRAEVTFLDSRALCWFTVPDVENWSPVAFPFQKLHRGLTHTIYKNKTVSVSSPLEKMSIHMPNLPSGVSINSFQTSNAFIVRFRNAGIGLSIDMTFLYIYRGAKLIINGTFNDPRDFSFKFASPRQIGRSLNKLSDGFLIFDYSDLVKTKQVFSYDHDTNKLTVRNLPSSFRIDPIFYQSGFETGDWGDEWSFAIQTLGETLNVTSAISHHGIFSCQFNSNGGGGGEYSLIGLTGLNSGDFYVQGQYLIELNGLADNGDYANFLTVIDVTVSKGLVTMGWAVDSGVLKWRFTYYDNGVLQISYSTSETTNLDEWYLIELHILIDGTSGIVEGFINGVERFSFSSVDTNNFGNVDGVVTGLTYLLNSDSMTNYVDCVQFSDTYMGIGLGDAPSIETALGLGIVAFVIALLGVALALTSGRSKR